MAYVSNMYLYFSRTNGTARKPVSQIDNHVCKDNTELRLVRLFRVVDSYGQN